jgi:hypothetical protein
MKTVKDMVDIGEDAENDLVHNLAVCVKILEKRLNTKHSVLTKLGLVVDDSDIA